MKTPREIDVRTKSDLVFAASEVAGEQITKLDHDYDRKDVLKIAEWIHYLSTQD